MEGKRTIELDFFEYEEMVCKLKGCVGLIGFMIDGCESGLGNVKHGEEAVAMIYANLDEAAGFFDSLLQAELERCEP